MALDFQLAAFLTGIVLFAAAALAYVTTRDTLHPMIYLGAMAFFLHAFLPLYLELSQPDELRGYLGQDELDYAQTIVLLGVLSLAGGVWWGAHATPTHGHASPVRLTDAARLRLAHAARALAALGLIAWIYQIIHSGGLYAVYGRAYGFFWADTGYVGEAFQFGLPGALLLLLARSGSRLRPRGPGVDRHRPAAAARPRAARGAPRADLHGARRRGGHVVPRARAPSAARARPAWRLGDRSAAAVPARQSRPHLPRARKPDFTGAGEAPTFEVGPGNEFVFGAGAALNAEALDSFAWGRRYLVVLFVRPIPRSLWPTKYADAARFLNIPSIDHVEKDPRLTDFTGTIGWTGAIGSAPGGIFDLWIEFWWAYLFAVFAVGWGFGRAYRKALSQGGFWLALYALMTALSIYFVMQGLAAFAVRALLLGAVMWLGWRYAIVRRRSCAVGWNSHPRSRLTRTA